MGLTKNLGWLSKYITADSSGYVGLGTTPTEKLTLESGNILLRTQGRAIFNRADNLIFTQLYDSGPYFALDNRNGNGFDFQSAGTSQMRVFQSGNVFIGPTPVDAGYKLDVNGTFRASSGNANSSVRSVYTNSTAYVTNGYSGIGTLAIENTSTTNGTGAGIVFIPKTTTGACIASIGAINESNSYASSLVFQTREVSGPDNERMRVTSRGSLLIGATSQSYNPSTQGYMLGVKSSVGQSFISIARSGQSLDSQGMIIGLDTSTGYIYMRDNVSLKFFTNDTERMIIDQTGVIISIPTYNNTTGAGANMYVSAGGAFCRSTSSLKYKKNVEDYSKGLNEIMQMRPVTYESINEEEDGVKYAGLIAEEIHNLGLTEFVQYAEDGTPDALSYANMVSLLVKGMQELTERIKILENK